MRVRLSGRSPWGSTTSNDACAIACQVAHSRGKTLGHYNACVTCPSSASDLNLATHSLMR
jgi:hypothetical protein